MSFSLLNGPNSAAAVGNCTRRISNVSTSTVGNAARHRQCQTRWRGTALGGANTHLPPRCVSSVSSPLQFRSFSNSSITSSAPSKRSKSTASQPPGRPPPPRSPSAPKKSYTIMKRASSPAPAGLNTPQIGQTKPLHSPVKKSAPVSRDKPARSAPGTHEPLSPSSKHRSPRKPGAVSDKKRAVLTPVDVGAVATKALAIDCEMIEMEKCEASPTNSGLARLSIVNYDGQVLLDTIVQPPGRILHCRSRYTGLTRDHFRGDFEIISFKKAQRIVLDYIEKGHVIVGHALDNDLVALNIKRQVPVEQTRDTSRLGTVLEKYGWNSQVLGLKKMTLNELGRVIQSGFHDSVVDARATMEIYRKYEKELDQEVIDRPEYMAHVRRLALAAKAEKDRLKAEAEAAAIANGTVPLAAVDKTFDADFPPLTVTETLLGKTGGGFPSRFDNPLTSVVHPIGLSIARRAYSSDSRQNGSGPIQQQVASRLPPIRRTLVEAPEIPAFTDPYEAEIMKQYFTNPSNFLLSYRAVLEGAAIALKKVLSKYPLFIGVPNVKIPSDDPLLVDYFKKEQTYRAWLEVKQHFLPDKLHHVEIYNVNDPFSADYERYWRRWTKEFTKMVAPQPIEVMREDVLRNLDLMKKRMDVSGRTDYLKVVYP